MCDCAPAYEVGPAFLRVYPAVASPSRLQQRPWRRPDIRALTPCGSAQPGARYTSRADNLPVSRLDTALASSTSRKFDAKPSSSHNPYSKSTSS
ncbi:hypothetical protein B0H19DRAFT_1203812 [Mycena capillaripes]|nr:hypothetical protein B0H19DRAFT_1203812 [Mycena capillaripes]